MKVQPMAGGVVCIRLDPKEQELLGLMLSDDVIGNEIDDVGIAGGFNAGLDLSDPYWGRDGVSQEAVGDLAAAILAELKGFDGAVQKWADIKDSWAKQQVGYEEVFGEDG